MLLLTCPVCAVTADETGFAYGGEYDVTRPQSASPAQVTPAALDRYLNHASAPPGPVREIWRCARGCGSWFGMERDTAANRVLSLWRLDMAAPESEA